ncbi:WD40-repeat-containing domain protein [Fennellomyces sp. T-0311]|nr:WD40-repeat-containing domain protein [Fennellomyces sp. T-0311]
MSVYSHRAMVTPQARIVEMLDAIRVEFESLAQEAYVCKTQRDDFEHKMNAQIQEMNSFQQSLLDLERTQQTLKEQYEEDIARLRRQLEQAQSRAGVQQPPVQHRAVPPPSNNSGHHPPGQQQPAPPNIGPGSNYFGGIMNAQHHNGSSTSQPSLAAPPQLDQPSQYPGYPPSQQQGPPPPPPSSSAPPPPLGYMNGSPNMPPPGSHPPPGMYGGRMPTSPAPGPYPRQEHGYGYPPRGGGGPGTPTSQPLPPSHHPPPAGSPDKRKPAPGPGLGVMPSRSSGSISKMGAPPTVPPGNLADVDPSSVPASMKIEGEDWFALFNPKVPRYLNVNLVHTLDHASVVCCVKFSADGQYLAAGCNRKTFIYDVKTAQQICALQDDSVQKDGDLYIRSVCFSPDGQYLATGAEDKQIRIWDIQKGLIRSRLRGHEQDIYSLDFSRDGRIVVSGSGDRTVRIWSMVEDKCMHTLQITDPDQKDPGVTSVAVSPDGRLVAAGSLDKMVRVWDVQTGQALERLEGHKDSVYSVAFMPDGRQLVSGSLDKTLKLWELGTSEGRGYGIERDRSKGPCKMTFTGHKDFVLSVACTPDGRWIVSGSKDRGVQFWDPRTGQTQFMLQGHKNSVISVAISPNGRPVFATGSGDNRARIWSYDPIA